MARGDAGLRFCAACVLPLVAFAAGATDQGAIAVGAFFAALVFLLPRATGSAAAWATLDSQELVAHFTLRPSESIPLARIAAVEVRRSLGWTRRSLLPERVSLIRVLRKDAPGVIEIRASSWEADPFLFALARNAKRLGLGHIAPFAIPRRYYVYDLLPLVPALAILVLCPFRVSWPSLGLPLAAFLVHSAFSWRALAKLSQSIGAGRVPAEVRAWEELLRRA